MPCMFTVDTASSVVKVRTLALYSCSECKMQHCRFCLLPKFWINTVNLG